MMLLLGPCKTKKDPTITGGTIVLFEDLVDWCKNNGQLYKVIDTNKNNYPNKLWAYLSIILSSIFGLVKCKNVTIHASNKDYLFIAPLIVLVSKSLKRKVGLRKFAGNFDTYYKESGFVSRSFLRYALRRADLIYFETKKLVDFGKTFNKNCYWFPNVRKANIVDQSSGFRKRFVFISQVKNSKGVIEICKVAKKLPKDYVIHVFGPIQKNELNTTGVEDAFNKIYKGALKSDEVLSTLKTYDVLLLPTYYEGEGYPGIIVEAYSMGLPVITTYWNSIPEIVEDKKTGLLIKIKEEKELYQAISFFDNENYNEMSDYVISYFKRFNRDSVYSTFFTNF